jgi:DNA mismatch repair protein MutS
VARLAGLPDAVLDRAEEVLRELESERMVEQLETVRSSGARRASSTQLGLFGAADHPLVEELRGLDPDRLTPLEALERIARWRARWLGSGR